MIVMYRKMEEFTLEKIESKCNWDEGFAVSLDEITGVSEEVPPIKRYLSHMKDMYYDKIAVNDTLNQNDPLIYEFYALEAPVDGGDIAFGTSIVYPGQIGDEYFMTKGHFHSKKMTAEVYYCLRGNGYILIENEDGKQKSMEFRPGQAVYVPKGYAHRTVNVGSTPLVFFYSFRADAGHDYKSIERKGFRSILVSRNGPQIVPNPLLK